MRDIWRHESEVTGLTPSTRVPYRGVGRRQTLSSAEFTPPQADDGHTTEDPADF